MKVIITIPAYNEEFTLPSVLKELKEVMDRTNYNYKLLVVNDGSIDRTSEVAKKNGAIVVENKRNLGLVETFKKEMKECIKLKADIIVHTDADGQYPAEVIPVMIKKVEEGNDLVLGSRFGRGRYGNLSLMKKLGNIAFAKVFSNLLKIKLNDTTTGFRAFTSEVAKLELINSFTYTQEQIIRAGKTGMRITEVPITARKTRKSKLFKNSFDYAIKAWLNIFRIYRDYDPLKFFGRLALLFFIPGVLLGLYLAVLYIIRGYIGHIGLIILTVLLLTMGLQIGLFGFLADMLKK